jgi:hypothetical protein
VICLGRIGRSGLAPFERESDGKQRPNSRGAACVKPSVLATLVPDGLGVAKRRRELISHPNAYCL